MSTVAQEMNGLLAIAEALTRFIDQRDVVHVVLDSPDHACVPVDSRASQEWLSGAFYKRFRQGVSSPSALRAAIRTIEAMAREEGVRHVLEPRFNADASGEIWLDLRDAQGRAIRVTPSGWDVVNQPPPRFRRFSHMLALPEPTRGGDLKRLRRYVNIAKDSDFMLLMVAMVVSMFSKVPRPLLLLLGGAGAAKTTSGNFLRRLIDPTTANGLALPTNERGGCDPDQVTAWTSARWRSA